MPIFFIHEINFSSNIISHLIFFSKCKGRFFSIIEFCACDSVIFIFTFLHFASHTLELLHDIYIRSAYDIFFALFCQQFGTNSQFVPAEEKNCWTYYSNSNSKLWFDHLTLLVKGPNLYNVYEIQNKNYFF